MKDILSKQRLCPVSLITHAFTLKSLFFCFFFFTSRTLIPGLTLHEPSLLYAYLALFTQSGLLQLLGCIGALKLNEKLLNMYWLLLLFLLFGDAFIGIVWIFRFDKIYTDLKPLLKQRLQSEYGVNEEFTNIWDSIQHDYQCCGVEGPQDFNNIDLTQRNGKKSNESVERTNLRAEESDRNRVIINRTLIPNDHTKTYMTFNTTPYDNATEGLKDLDSYTTSLLSSTVTMSSISNSGLKDSGIRYVHVHNVPESCCRRLKDPVPVGEKEEEKVEEPQSKPTAVRQRLEKKKNRNPTNVVKRSANLKDEIRHQKSKLDTRQLTTPSADESVCEEGSKNCKNKRHALDSKLQYRSSHMRHDSPYRNTHHYSTSSITNSQNATSERKPVEPKFLTGNLKIMDTCANVNGYAVGTIYGLAETLHYSAGCEVKLKKWLRDSAHVLGVLGYCVIAFLKLCFLGILRYEIKEMIQKIKMLQGELQPPILLLSAETPNENPEINSPTSPHICNHLDNSILTGSSGKHQNPIESGMKSNLDRTRANSVGNAFLLLQPHESGQTTPVHQIKTIQMTQQNHRLFNNILTNDTGNDSDTNSHCALLIDGDDIPPKKQHNRMSSNGNNNFESHELQDLLLRNSAQI